MEEKFKAYQICNFFASQLKNENVLILDNNIHFNGDWSTKPIVDEIKNKKPKEVFFHYPTECAIRWMDCYYYEMDNLTKTPDKSLVDLENVLIDLNVQFYLILGSDNPKLHKNFNDPITKIKNFTILYWPTYLISHTYINLRDSLIERLNNNDHSSFPDQTSIEKKFDFLYLNYNNKPRYHRCFLMDKLCENDLLKYGINSWNILSYEQPNQVLDLTGVYKYNFKCWNEKIIDVDRYLDPNKTHVDEYSDELLKPNTLISLVAETSKDVPFITEKTFRPILLEHPFLCLGAPEQNTKLLDYGFELYDEIFDYSKDKDESLEVRIQSVIDNLNSIKNKNYYEIYELLRPKILRNKKRLIDIYENDKTCPYIPFYLKYRDLQ
jgi:hypothetical protein